MSWTVKVKFQDPVKRAVDQPEFAFPNTECAQALRNIASKWDVSPDEYEEYGIKFSDDEITLGCDIIDYFADFVNWILMHTVPQEISIVSNDD